LVVQLSLEREKEKKKKKNIGVDKFNLRRSFGGRTGVECKNKAYAIILRDISAVEGH
jgi:hypothetical protein